LDDIINPTGTWYDRSLKVEIEEKDGSCKAWRTFYRECANAAEI
jgi:hypothetical protein